MGLRLLIKNADWIITADAENRIIKNGYVLIEGNVITEVGEWGDYNCQDQHNENLQVIDAAGKVVIPGLVNTHHHFYQTLTRCIPAVQDIPLFPWLERLYEIWKELTPEAVRIASYVAMGELLLTGCTTTTDHHYVFPMGESRLIDEQIAVAAEIGMRFHPTRGSMSLSKEKGGLPPAEVVQDEESILRDSERLIETYHDPGRYSMLRVALAPCSPFSVTGLLMKETADLARRHKVMLHTHLAETKDEEAFCIEKYGKRPLEYLEELGWLGEDVWFAHGIHFTVEEISLLGRTGTGIAHCPTSNEKLASGVCRVKELQESGAKVGLAVDGSASNDSSNMLGELKTAYLLQKLIFRERGLSAEEILKMATVGGARVLGRDDIGSIAPKMAADLVLIDFQRLGYAGCHDPVGAVVTAGDSHLVDTVIVDGKVLVKGGRLLKIDEGEIVERANDISSQMLKKASLKTKLDYLKKQ